MRAKLDVYDYLEGAWWAMASWDYIYGGSAESTLPVDSTTARQEELDHCLAEMLQDAEDRRADALQVMLAEALQEEEDEKEKEKEMAVHGDLCSTWSKFYKSG